MEKIRESQVGEERLRRQSGVKRETGSGGCPSTDLADSKSQRVFIQLA